jgi:hypothetical protein
VLLKTMGGCRRGDKLGTANRRFKGEAGRPFWADAPGLFQLDALS